MWGRVSGQRRGALLKGSINRAGQEDADLIRCAKGGKRISLETRPMAPWTTMARNDALLTWPMRETRRHRLTSHVRVTFNGSFRLIDPAWCTRPATRRTADRPVGIGKRLDGAKERGTRAICVPKFVDHRSRVKTRPSHREDDGVRSTDRSDYPSLSAAARRSRSSCRH